MRRCPVTVYHRLCKNLQEDFLAINVATWNVRKLHDDTDFKLTRLLNDMQRFHIDILGVSETHRMNETTEAFQKEQHVLTHSCRTDHIHRQDVAIILKEKLAKQLVAYDLINERIVVIQLKTVQESLFVFQVYAPDSSYSPDLQDEFYSLLQQ